MITEFYLELSQSFDNFEIMIDHEGVRLIAEEYSTDLTDDKVKELNDALTRYLEEREREKRGMSKDKKAC